MQRGGVRKPPAPRAGERLSRRLTKASVIRLKTRGLREGQAVIPKRLMPGSKAVSRNSYNTRERICGSSGTGVAPVRKGSCCARASVLAMRSWSGSSHPLLCR